MHGCSEMKEGLIVSPASIRTGSGELMGAHDVPRYVLTLTVGPTRHQDAARTQVGLGLGNFEVTGGLCNNQAGHACYSRQQSSPVPCLLECDYSVVDVITGFFAADMSLKRIAGAVPHNIQVSL